jgi:hypothetical protein
MDKSIIRPFENYCDEKSLLFYMYNHSTDFITTKQRCRDINPSWDKATTLVNIKASAPCLVTEAEAPALSVVVYSSACHLLHAAFLLGLFFGPKNGGDMFL